MKSNTNQRYVKALIVAFAIIYSFGYILVPKAMAQGIYNLALFYRVRFEVLGQSPKGYHYIDLFDVYAMDITEIIMRDSSLTWESINVLIKWQPNLDALVNGHGDEAVVSEDDVTTVKNYLNLIVQQASPELKSAIDEELLATPLEDMIGMTMNQAWSYLNEDPRFQAQILEPQKFSHLKLDSTNTIVGPVSENFNYEIGFDEETWALSSWNNEVADSWVAKNNNLLDCILTAPRSVSNPYTTLDVSYKTLGDVQYKIQTDEFKSKKLTMTVYILYQPIDMVGQDRPPFILYPGSTNAAQCIDQSEIALASLHFVYDSQPIQ